MWTRLALLVALLAVPVRAKPTADELCRQAAALVEQHKIQPGLKKYFEAIRIDPRCAKAHAGLGELYYQVCQPGSSCTHGFISLPYLTGPTLEWMHLPDVRFLWLIPVTQAEVEFKKRAGIEALEKRFESTQFNYLDPLRPSVA